MSSFDSIFDRLRVANETLAERYPGEPAGRQPVHTVYGGAHLFRADTAARLGSLALRSLDAFAASPFEFARAIGLPGASAVPEDAATELREQFERDPATLAASNRAAWLACSIDQRVREKLAREPVEDFRIDFEDGYGHRPDDEEDACAASAAAQVAAGMEAGTLPPYIGIRVKPLSGELHRRAVRTTERFVATLIERAGRLPEHFVFTIPKVMIPEQVEAAAAILGELEQRHRLEPGSMRLELMIETTQSIIGSDGRCSLPGLLEAAAGRCVAMHFGVYDYTASCAVTAQHQAMGHPVCDFARHVMQVAMAGTGVMLSDGATNVMPVPLHRAGDVPLTADEERANRAAVHRAWRQHYDDVRHSLRHAYYQGWDLNPAQLPTRYAAVYAFFLESLDSAAERLSNFVEQAAQATLVGSVFDDAATGQGLLNFFLRGMSCGAINEEEAERCGLTAAELQSRSFVKILEGRR